MTNFLLSNNIYEQTFYNETELDELCIAFKNGDLEKFRNFMLKLADTDLIIQHIEISKMKISVDEFRNKMMEAILRESYEYDAIKFMDLLINEYGLILTDEFIAGCICIYRVNFNIFAALHKYTDVKKHISVIKYYFNSKCYKKSVATLQKFVDLGYNIAELCENDSIHYSAIPIFSALANNDTSVLVFLLQHNINYKKYELDILRYCINKFRYQHLKILIEYGLDLQLLNQMNLSDINPDKLQIVELLLQNNIDARVIIMAIIQEKTHIDHYLKIEK